jgi:hypothetical protein
MGPVVGLGYLVAVVVMFRSLAWALARD